MAIRGIRGATTVEADEPDQIDKATRELLDAILAANPSLRIADLASCFFSSTPDLVSAYPAKSTREMGWNEIAFFCLQEQPVRNSLKRCIRVLLHWNTDLNINELHHVYLHDAAQLRPDWINEDTR